ncbi:fido domain-containing protein [Pholiota molesta]|nr:fido domain-containing protein [Pholiota molesta]
MSNLHLGVFFNTNRPQLLQPSVTELPLDVLGPQLTLELRNSLSVDPSNVLACAASARLWESLLKQHRLPYLLLRVADMRATLNSNVTALILYEELQGILRNPLLYHWIARYRASVLNTAELQLNQYKHDPSMGFTPSQRWRPTAGHDPFPYFRLQRAEIDMVRAQWKNLGHQQHIMSKFLNLHCVETNDIEGLVHFNLSASTVLVQLGFYNQVEPVDGMIRGVVRDRASALSLLQDTHEALDLIFAFLRPNPPYLSIEVICDIHATLMKTCQVLPRQTSMGLGFSHTNTGITRQTSRVNVTVVQANMKIQFCPYDEVNAELTAFCERFNQLIYQRADIDPFAAAAWISHVFVAIHPFEDGNGRMSRILASIPLLRSKLPPLCVPSFYRNPYYTALNNIRANRDGDYAELTRMLHQGTVDSLERLANMGTAA